MLVGSGWWAGTGNGHSKVAKQSQAPLGMRACSQSLGGPRAGKEEPQEGNMK